MSTEIAPEIHVSEAVRLTRSGCLLLDVREDYEWQAGHAPDAIHVPLASLATAPLPSWGSKRVVVACRSGNRARTATLLLRHRGVQALTLTGGMNAWAQHGAPVVTSSGGTGRVA